MGPTARRRAPVVSALLGGLALFVMLAASVAFGTRDIAAGELWQVIAGHGDAYLTEVVSTRVPRTVIGAVVGAALAVSGCIIQGITRNPLGEPGLLGVTAGASAAVVTAVGFFGLAGAAGAVTGSLAVWIALPGALAAVVVVYFLGRPARSESVIPLVLAGAVVSAVLYAYIQAMILTNPGVFESYRHWVVGSLAGAEFETLGAVAPALIVGAVLAGVLASSLNSLALGDDVAVSLGVPVPWVRAGGILAATLLAAGATAAIGPVAFVGLAVPHLVRAMGGTDMRWQVPLCVVWGAVMLLGSDVLARVVARPQELMVGVVTAFLGAPFLLAAVRRGKVGN